MRKQEEKIQIQLSDYIKMQYPNVIFTFDASGLRLPIGLAKKAKRMRSGRGMPDMMIFKPMYFRDTHREYCGLFIEIKTKGSDVYLKDEITLKKDEHVEEQAAMIDRLSDNGYCATFGFGFDGCKEIIDWYLK